jgi:hypothetical protein
VTLIAEAYDAYALEFVTVRKRATSAALEFEPYDFAAEAEAGAVQASRPAALGFSPAPS